MSTENPQNSLKYILAIDLGSGGPKVGIVDSGGHVIASAVERTTIQFYPNGGAEQDPHEWWHAISLAAKSAIKNANLPPEAIFAVTCTSQWSVTVPVDENGEPLMNAIHWMDSRGAPYNRAITRSFPSVQGYGLAKLMKWVKLTGMVPTNTGLDAMAHMLFIKYERPEIYQKTWKLLEPMDYINLKLSGKCVASQVTVIPMIVVDNRIQDPGDYHPWLVEVSGIDKSKLPELVPNGHVIGKIAPSVAAEWGLSPNTEVIMGANDNQTAAIGAGAVLDYDIAMILGSSGFLAGHLPFRKTDILHMLTTLPSPLPGRSLFWGELGNSGKVLDSYLNNLVFGNDEFGLGQAPEDVYHRANAVAEKAPPGSDGVIFLPWFNPPLGPEEDRFMRGGFLNLTHKTTHAHLTRAVFEGIAFNWNWLIGQSQKFTGREFKYFRLGGGGAQSPVMAQTMADVVGLPMHCLADPRNANVVGAALLAFYQTGMITLEEIPEKVQIARVYEPRQENRQIYDRLFKQFLNGFKSLKPVYHTLNR
jgi:xylulokinase